MKALFILLSFVIMTEALSQAKPVSLKGQADAGYTLPKQEIQVPNKQYTNTGGLSGLIETGNDNLLSNPGFEASTYSSGWTLGGTGTHSVESAELMFGAKAARVDTTAQTLSIIQDSTMYASVFATALPQGYVRAWIYNTAANATICARSAGTTLTGNNCITLQTSAGYKFYEIPVVLGGTSNGLEVSATSTTGITIVDRTYIGVSPASPQVAQAQLAGAAYIAPTASCSLSRTNTSYGAPTTTAACPGPTIITQNIGSWQTTDADNAIFTINSLPPGKYVGVAEFQMNNATAGAVACGRVSDGTNNGQGACTSDSATSASTGLISHVEATYTDTGNRTFTFQTRASSGQANITNTANYDGIKFTLYYYPPASAIYSQPNNSDTDWVSCGLTTSDFTGFGTVSSIQDQCKKDGDDLLVRLKFTGGTPTATEARIALKLQGVALTSASSSVIPSIQFGGIAQRSNPGQTETYWALIEPSVTYMTMGFQSSTTPALTKQNGSALLASGASLFVQARFPIAGWTKSQITGTFANVVTAPNISKPKQFSFNLANSSTQTAPCTASPCTVNSNNGGVVTGITRTSGGLYVVAMSNLGSAELMCFHTVRNFASGSTIPGCYMTVKSQTSMTWQCTAGAGTVMDSAVDFQCQGVAP